MTALIKALLLLTVFLTPLIGAFGNFGYEQAKVLFFIVLTTLIGFLWLLFLIKNPQFKLSGIAKAAGLFLIALLITSLMGVNPAQSILGTQPYFQGWILYAYLFLFFLLVSWSKIKLKYWAYVLVGSATIVGVLAIKDWVLLNVFHQLIPTYAGRVVSTFGQPNFYAGYILLILPFFHFLLARKNRFWSYVLAGFLIAITSIGISYSRAAFLGVAGLLVFWLTWELGKLRFAILLMAVIILMAAISLSVYFSSGFLEKEFAEIKTTSNPDLVKIGVEKRYYFWPILGQLILEKPIQGYGLENIAPIFSKYFKKNKHALFEENLKVQPYMFGLKDLNLDRSHNYILDLLLFSGILGLLGWLGMVILLFKKLTQKYDDRRKNVLLVSLIVYLVWIQFQNQSVVHLVYFWLLIGIVDQNT